MAAAPETPWVPAKRSRSGPAGGVGLQQSPPDDSQEDLAPPPGFPEAPAQPRSQNRWNEWLQTASRWYEFHEGDRIFEFSDRYSRTGWKQYDLLSQDQLKRIFTDHMIGGGRSTFYMIDCLGWNYSVKFDLFHQEREAFLNAPSDAIGYQVSNHEIIKGTKRWIRLTTYPGA